MLREILIFIFKKACRFFSGCTTESSRFFKIVYKLLICPLKSTTAEIKGHKIFLDSNDSLCLSILGEHDPYETLCIEKIVKKNDTVLDVGANIGYFTLILARLVGENGKVFAFEPDPDNMVLLQKNINENGYKNLEFIQKAVSDKTGKCKLYLNKENKGNHTIYAPHENSQFIEIESIRLDDYFKDYDKKINFVKIDVEGAEETVLEPQKCVKLTSFHYEK